MDQIRLSSVVYFFSLSFILFAGAVLPIYWITPVRKKNLILLIISYSFYCSWDWRFLSLLLLVTLISYTAAIFIEDSPSRRSFILVIAISVILGILLLFKYFQFFIDGLIDLFNLAGFPLQKRELELILPLGISFYSFQSISYITDVYWNKVKAHRNFLEFSLFLGYFPQLIAGPIERTGHLLPQLLHEKKWQHVSFKEAFYLFSWGWFKKRVIADYLTLAIENGYAHSEKPGLVMLIGLCVNVFKLYADISGYADMARGVSLLFGIRLSRNFNFPFFSENPSEFWQRWHITLAVWARHYVFNPLLTKFRRPTFAVMVTFLVMGAWLGPEWHYIEWGMYWALCTIAYQYLLRMKLWSAWFMIPVIFVGQSFFSSGGITNYLRLLSQIGHRTWDFHFLNPYYIKVFFIITLFVVYELMIYRKNDELYVCRSSFKGQVLFYLVLYFLYRNIGEVAAMDFIYFQY